MEALKAYFKAHRGAQARLAEFLGISRPRVSQWKHVPVEFVPEVEEFTKISRVELIPDAFRKTHKSAEED